MPLPSMRKELITAHGPDVVSYLTIQRWRKKSKDRIVEIEDNPRSGRPVIGEIRKTFKKFEALLNKTHILHMTTLKRRLHSLVTIYKQLFIST